MKRAKLIAIICISPILFYGSCASVSRRADSQPVTAILGAFQKELMMLDYEIKDRQVRRIEGMRFVSGELNGRRVVVAWTGVGKVNTAMTATLLIEHFRPEEVIFTGIAGAVNPELAPGDIVIAAETAHHDMGVFTADGFYYRAVRNPLDGWRNPVLLPADERLLKLAQKVAKQVKLETIKTSMGQRDPKIITGVVVTGDVFVASATKGAELRQQLKADAVEMEGAAVAQICYQRNIPHLVIRSISDKADETAREDSFRFQDIAASNSARLIIELIGLLGSKVSLEKGQK